MFAWDDSTRYRISPPLPDEMRHVDVMRCMSALQTQHPDAVSSEQLGESVEGRAIGMHSLGTGPKTVLAWSQMHGDEPTHTAALLDLMNFLLSEPRHPTARVILERCTLHLIPMLNPDGAQRWTRRNAQDLDINRDALHLQTPEGRLLRDVVQRLRPAFALNLHNQRPRTTSGTSKQVAAFAVLAPPIDDADSTAENVLRAKRLAGYLADIVAPHCPGPVARYNADFMPRCFGEWVQQQGAATITIEAGGWSTVDTAPLVPLHFFGLVNCLEAIATDGFLGTDLSVYEALPRTGEHDLFDQLLRNVLVLNGNGNAPFRADVGIDFAKTSPTPAGGKIVDLGDLSVTTGKVVTESDDLICLPGRIVAAPNLSPTTLPDSQMATALLSSGITTVLGCVEIASEEQVKALAELPTQLELPVNVGFVVTCSDWTAAAAERLVHAIAAGALGIVTDDLPIDARRFCEWFDLPILNSSAPSLRSQQPKSLLDCATSTFQCAELLQPGDRSSVKIGTTADLLLIAGDMSTAILDDDLRQVLVAGSVVYDQGKLTGATPGVLITRSRRSTSEL